MSNRTLGIVAALAAAGAWWYRRRNRRNHAPASTDNHGTTIYRNTPLPTGAEGVL
ncbi:MAG TPA: hypothetical protein VFK20_09735 [Vicinamibacterales bacterium]|nr:hypothetical protein [Vicinamibacterales bacterium]